MRGSTVEEPELDIIYQDILRFIVEFNEHEGYPPTVRELCEQVTHNGKGGPGRLVYSTSTMQTRLDWLERHGFISRSSKSPRTLRVLKPAPERRTI